MNHEHYMQLALDLAQQGWPKVAPNPMVGCVIVHNNTVVAQGYHEQYGLHHAEVNAINSLDTEIDPKECVLYVSLEPCSHHGKTPPCADLIISKGFKKVVIACKDPNPLVSGNGISKLKQAGINVIEGVLELEAKTLNKRFITFFEKKRPYYILKWAQTADGFMSRTPLPANKTDNKISGPEAQKMVHALRASEMAIMVGKNTVLLDDPSLTTRLVEGKNPVRIFIDRNLEVQDAFNIYEKDAETIVFNGIKDEVREHVQFIKLNFDVNILSQISDKLVELNIQSVLVEGGTTLLNDFIQQNIFDEILVFENPNLKFGTGKKAPQMNLVGHFDQVGEDKLYKFLG
ncbi:MAG: bifunctional diaminohydroxyphosphoribosylaminopyrimidine deaminase/5-amino-6-(5-phosphoribosylamino)uracil reductase RibD [Bacteroidetes bacterium]|nr:bifunctional diaminohydroxyphosphoribosylaminopyrimidine deaminase/5-amino-6-(5-phosphoribosylamino)uracil reductase RibD [Bacteroidota bacterium]